MIGRKSEIKKIIACLSSGRSILLEGPVGVGKTFLAQSVSENLGRPVFRIDGDSRYTEQKLTGWFDPPLTFKKGYTQETFIDGPLSLAMKKGGILFINELNRLPEGVQNILLPALDEKMIQIPKLGSITAKDGFAVVATQNPKEFIATSPLSEALMDRLELLYIDYQSRDEEIEIVEKKIQTDPHKKEIASRAVTLVRKTRTHPQIKRGASVRAAIAIAELTLTLKNHLTLDEAIHQAAQMALPNRIELQPSAESAWSSHSDAQKIIQDLLNSANDLIPSPSEKKN